MEITSRSVEKEVQEIQEQYQVLKNDVEILKTTEQLQDKEISHLKSKLDKIQDDTTWIRRQITGAFITAFATAFVGGIVGVLISNF